MFHDTNCVMLRSVSYSYLEKSSGMHLLVRLLPLSSRCKECSEGRSLYELVRDVGGGATTTVTGATVGSSASSNAFITASIPS